MRIIVPYKYISNANVGIFNKLPLYLLNCHYFSNVWNACGVMVIVVGNGHGDTSSNPGRD